MKQIMQGKKQLGFSLVEIMVALLIGTFLMSGVIQIFLSSTQTFRMQDGMSRLQENGRFSMNFITRDLRMAGFGVCDALVSNDMDPQNPNPNLTPLTLITNPIRSITGSNNETVNWNATACGASNDCIAGTDTISYHFGQTCANLVGNMATDNANIQINAGNSCNIQQYDVLLLSNCVNADIFIASNISSGDEKQTISHANNQNTSSKLSAIYSADAQLFKLQSATFFIRNGANGGPSLWKMDSSKPSGAGNPLELVEGVENMQIFYGEDTDLIADMTANYYVTASDVVDWGNVVSVRISLLVRTLKDNLASKPLQYTYDGTTELAKDRRLRRVYTTTIALRNRL